VAAFAGFACWLCAVSAFAEPPPPSQPDAPRVLTDERLFHPAPRVPQRVWSDSVPGGVEAISLAAADGVTLRGWLYPAADPNAAWVIAFHGNNGYIADTFTQARTALFFGQLGLNVVAFDYRGTGFSDGEISLKLARDDALAMHDFAAKKAAGKPLFVVGWSLGSIFASHAAASRASVAGLVLLAPIASESVAASFHAVAAPEVAEGMRNAAELRGYRSPLLVVHGTRDSVIPIAQGREDYEAAASPDKRFVAVDGKGHGDGILSIEADDAIAAFFAKQLAKPGPVSR
jgi:alpha-beta hydrolase superfamily lysophospholipase